jgi:hypothetical protein
MFFKQTDRSRFACKALETPDDWIVDYQTKYISHLGDADDIIDIELPAGWKLIGLSNPHDDEDSKLKYGLVDFTSLDAK